MERYDYLSAVISDVEQYIEDNIEFSDYTSKDELASDLYEQCFIDDSVTGNASGSYTCNAWRAEEYVCHNLDLAKDAYDEFGGEPDLYSPESIDVTIRCYLLSEAIAKVLEDIELSEEEEEEEEDENE